MFSANNKISIRQLQVLLALDVFGTGVIILPRRVAQYANQDGWIIIILATCMALLFAYLITSIGRMFPNESFFSYTSKIVSRPIALMICLIFIVKIIISVALELRLFGEIIKQTLLFKTPYYVICGTMLLIGAYAAYKGYETRARLAEILILFIFFPLIFVFGVAAVKIDFTNLMPVMVTPPGNLFQGAYVTGIAFTGLEFCLLVHPFISKPKKVRKGVSQVVVLIGFFMVLITAITIAKFGYLDVQQQMWPVLEIMDLIDLPGSFIERQDALILSFWIISIFAITNAGLFFSSLLIRDCFKSKKAGIHIIICAVIIFIVSYLPNDMNQVYRLMDAMFQYFGIAYMFFIPLILLIVAKLRRLGDKN